MNIISIKVSQEDIEFAKEQINAFEKSKAGKWRYSNVEAWRGIVCEMLTSDWLCSHYQVSKKAKGIDTSGIVDECDLIINTKKIEIKSATKLHFKYIMPKIHDIDSKPKDVYIGARYNETVEPNEVQIIGFIKLSEVKKFPIKRNKGAAYYEIPFSELIPFKI